MLKELKYLALLSLLPDWMEKKTFSVWRFWISAVGTWVDLSSFPLLGTSLGGFSNMMFRALSTGSLGGTEVDGESTEGWSGVISIIVGLEGFGFCLGENLEEF